jgi:hypothetical protein
MTASLVSLAVTLVKAESGLRWTLVTRDIGVNSDKFIGTSVSKADVWHAIICFSDYWLTLICPHADISAAWFTE